MLLLLIASSNVTVIIIGTFLAGKSPGIVVPSSLQKQSGRTHTDGSQAGAELGSLSISVKKFHKIKPEALWGIGEKIFGFIFFVEDEMEIFQGV